MQTAEGLWRDFSFVASSSYRERVLASLAAKPKFPSQLAEETRLRLGHVSRALREMSKRGLVECLTPEAKARGRLYGTTSTGSALLGYLQDSHRRFVPSGGVHAYVGLIPKIRASTVIRFLDALDASRGPAAVGEAIRNWTVDRRALSENMWLSVDDCAELLDLAEAKFGDGSYGFIRTTSAGAVSTFPTIAEQLSKALPLEALAERAPIVWAKEWNFGRIEVATGRRRAKFSHFDWLPTPAMCAMFHGIYEGVLRARGYTGKVAKTRCVLRGDDHCEYEVAW